MSLPPVELCRMQDDKYIPTMREALQKWEESFQGIFQPVPVAIFAEKTPKSTEYFKRSERQTREEGGKTQAFASREELAKIFPDMDIFGNLDPRRTGASDPQGKCRLSHSTN